MRFIKNYPVLLISDIKAIVIADLHIGISYELYKSGINIPNQVKEMKKTIEKLIRQTKVKTLIVLGDVKHDVPGINYQEMKGIPEFMKDLSQKIKERYKVETTGKLEFIIMPAFNRLLGGTPVNVKRNNDELLGPLLKNNFVNMNESEIYLLDGTYLGKLKNLIY